MSTKQLARCVHNVPAHSHCDDCVTDAQDTEHLLRSAQPAPDAEGEWRIDEVLKSLFTNGAGEEADRLLLIKEPHSGAAKVTNATDLGGYSKAAVRSILKGAFGASTQEKQ